MLKEKIKSPEEIIEIARKLKEDGKIIVSVNGAFDILHAAHVNLLEKAKEEGDTVVVFINSDESIKKFKGQDRPINCQEDRAYVLAGLESISYVTIFEEDKPIHLFEKIKPDKHVRGGSFDPERLKEEIELFKTWGGKYINLPLEEGFSSTNIIEKIRKT